MILDGRADGCDAMAARKRGARDATSDLPQSPLRTAQKYAILLKHKKGQMLRQAFTDFIFATNTDRSGKAAVSYVCVFSVTRAQGL